MNIRTISLFAKCAAIDSLTSTSNHMARLDGDILRINKNQNFSSSINQPVLSGLIDEARIIEWRKRTTDEKELITNLVSDLNLDHNQFLVDLHELGPERTLSFSNSSPHVVTLKQIAKAIVERKSLFLVPSNLQLPEHSKDTVLRIIKSIASEAVLLIESASNVKGISFSFLPFTTEGTKNDHKNSYHSELIKQIFIHTSSINNLDRHNQNTTSLQTCFLKPGPMLLEGETGTGKSLTAELLATNNQKSMIYINISSISKELLESRMRGFLKGSFTGAINTKNGWFEKADNNVLFLDEFQNASIETQTQLLDLLDPISNSVVIRKVGAEDTDIHLDVKVILAINEPLNYLIEENRLRKDLYHRIRSTYTFPSLKSRFQPKEGATTEIKLLIKKLLFVYRWKSAPIYSGNNLTLFNTGSLDALFPRFDDEVIEMIRVPYGWPGNFRELQTFVFDLYWKVDKENAVFSAELIRRDLAHKILIEENSLSLDIDGSLLAKINAVEKELITSDFVITRAIKNLKNYKLGSYDALKKFIKKHKELFDKDILKDSKMIKILT